MFITIRFIAYWSRYPPAAISSQLGSAISLPVALLRTRGIELDPISELTIMARGV